MTKKAKVSVPDAEHAAHALAVPFEPYPTYPLSPSEIEIIVHASWDGKAFGQSQRYGTDAIQSEGEALRTFVTTLAFNPAYRAHDARTVELAPANDEDTRWLIGRAHRLQLVTSDGSLPNELADARWKAGKPGVQKADGIGILLVRPAA